LNNDNIFTIQGGKKDEDDDTLPLNEYTIIDIDGDHWPAEGFLVFTSQHVAVMRDTGKGAIPAMCIPLDRVKVAGLTSELFDDE
jgi:hypothetical protein